MEHGNDSDFFRGELAKEDEMVAMVEVKDARKLFVSDGTPKGAGCLRFVDGSGKASQIGVSLPGSPGSFGVVPDIQQPRLC